jgi:hypothetical protein
MCFFTGPISCLYMTDVLNSIYQIKLKLPQCCGNWICLHLLVEKWQVIYTVVVKGEVWKPSWTQIFIASIGEKLVTTTTCFGHQVAIVGLYTLKRMFSTTCVIIYLDAEISDTLTLLCYNWQIIYAWPMYFIGLDVDWRVLWLGWLPEWA